ncbi:Por secretion system C-terminal sorting domain-containing protein [Cyclonatronum proteinivorum]|uniref:Por secretion system C-terminal sorting domain-containing protein n=1 Tax=Cyclonatronum proteinivorum TaxID=1457365 RepID=A0A345UNF4_9BACT|nr:T9SS type A sorting domain-containing protein [Cyclonatronum proteinivorum]AXJ02006.1 Por secretion system C-terminal sorting domain-containing protein [Cyclonatronum proteinivorum]
MKQIYKAGKGLLAASLLLFGTSAVANAQVFQMEAQNQFPSTQITEPVSGVMDSEILFQQNRADTGGIVSGTFEGLGTATFSADDFELSTPATLTSISVLGFQNNATYLDGILLGVQVYIFSNAGGAPGGQPYDGDALLQIELDLDDPRLEVTQESNLYTFNVDVSGENWFLPAERYWLSVAPVQDLADLDGANRWNWAQGEQNFGEPMLVDPDNNFNGNFFDWTPFSVLGIDWNPSGLVMTIEGIPGEASVDLGPFSLLSPPNGIEVDLIFEGDTEIAIQWEASENATDYAWVAHLEGNDLTDPLLNVPTGAETELVLTDGAIYGILTDLGVEPGTAVTIDWSVVASAGDNTLFADETWSVTFTLVPATNIGRDEIVSGFELGQNYPNPFNPTTNISFTLPEASEVSLEVFNMQGQRVATLANGSFSAGNHTVTFDAANLSSGIYLYRMTSGAFTQTNKMMLVK